jgi:hypothetical protein
VMGSSPKRKHLLTTRAHKCTVATSVGWKTSARANLAMIPTPEEGLFAINFDSGIRNP